MNVQIGNGAELYWLKWLFYSYQGALCIPSTLWLCWSGTSSGLLQCWSSNTQKVIL